MNMKLSSRVIASMSLAALLFASTACKQPAGTSSPAPLSEDQKAVDAVKGKITGETLKTMQQAFTPKLGDKAVEVSGTQITVPAASTFDAQLNGTGVTAEVVFEGPKGATATVTKNSSDATKYDVVGGEVDEEFTVFAKLTKKNAKTKAPIGTYKIKANADLAALKTAADKLDLGKLRGEFDPKATTGIVDIPNDKTSITIPAVPTVESGATAAWESDNTAINVSNGAVTHLSHTAGATVCKISLKLEKSGKSKTVHVATFKVMPKAESNDDKAVVEIESLIKKNLGTVQAAFEPKLTSGKATVGKDVSEISVPAAATFGSDLKSVAVAVGFVAPQSATSKIELNSSGKYTVTHGSADETWKVVAKLTKGDAIKTVEIGSYTVEKKAVVKTELTVNDTNIAQITVGGVAVAGSAGNYTVTLEENAFNTLAKDHVVINASAINGLEASSYQQNDVFKVTVEAGTTNKTVKIELADGAKAKYTFNAITITVSKAVAKTELTVNDTNIAQITVGGVAVAGSAGNYTVTLEENAFNTLAKDHVVINASAINGLEASSYQQNDVFKVTVEAGTTNKTVKIELADGAKAKYTFNAITITVSKAVAKTELTVNDTNIAQITVGGVAVAGSAGNYTVTLEENAFNTLAKDHVVINASAINGLEASSYQQNDVFKVTVEAGTTNKTVKIELADGAKAKYTFNAITITVSKAVAKTELTVNDTNIAQITVGGVAVAGSAGNYTVTLEENAFNTLAKDHVVINASAINGLEASSYQQNDVFKVTVEAGTTNKTVKIELADGAKAKYTFNAITITVSKS